MTTGSFVLSADHPLRRLRSRALIAAAVAIVLCLLGALLDPQQLVRSYLIGYAFWLGIALGSMAILMIHHVAGGAWGAVIRRPLESATRTIPLLAVLFLPIALGTGALYEWAHPEVVAHDPILAAKAVYLNVPFFLVRAVIYFVDRPRERAESPSLTGPRGGPHQCSASSSGQGGLCSMA
jgi:hypothetical protein